MTNFVSPIVDIISRLWPCCATHTSYLCKLQDNKILLRNAMAELKEVRDDVQRRVIEAEADPNEPKKRTNPVSGWLQRVETINGEVEVIMHKADEQLSRARSCLGGCCPPNNCCSNYKLGKSIAKKIPFVDELKVNGKFEELTYKLPPPFVQDMNLEPTVGMESMFDKIWSLINSTNDTQPVSNIIGLYGQGGVGKTTLLEKINNEFHNKICTGEHGFDHIVMFVVVSKPIKYEAIQKKFGERLGLSLQGDGDESSRAEKIFNMLSNKNFVILLDDIWERVDLRRIGIPIIHPQGKSKLIFTTRSERVCGEMKADKKFKVECLPWDKAWILFQEMVGEDALNSFPDASELAKVVAEECVGLPLALITIGRAMSTKKSVQEWRDAITTLRRYASKFQDMRDKVLPRLKMSYDNLPNETEKSCFRYCALFPEDYSIEIAKLVDYWIAEGFLDGFDNNLDEARNRGHTFIGSLKSACLLESSGEDHVKMHDVIRDLALWIVNDDCSSSSSSSRSTRDESGNNSDNKFLVAVNDPCKKWKNAERIFWDADSIFWDADSTTSPPTSPNLLTLIVKKTGIVDSLYGYWPQRFRLCRPLKDWLGQSFFQDMHHLRVLDLSNGPPSNGEFPISICELHELQYLNLSVTGIKELPVELRKLVKLKFLILYHTVELTKIPAGLIASLSELQVLDLGCSNDDENYFGFLNWELGCGPSFSELDGLKQLQEVRIAISTFVALDKFLSNRKLQMVCTGLKFSRSSSSPYSNMYKFLSLTSSSSSSSSSSTRRRVLDLSNFKSLKDLYITGFGLLDLEELVLYGSIPDGGGGLLSNLERLTLDRYFPKLNSIRWMTAAQPDHLLRSHFQSLHYIRITGCHALKDLTWLVYVQNLKTLYVHYCDGIETIIELGDDQMLNTEGGGGEEEGVFRRLKRLDMDCLPKLKRICRHALAFPSIEVIRIHGCPELKKLPLGSGSNVNNTLKRIQGAENEWWNELQWEDETIKSKFLPYLNKWEYDDVEVPAVAWTM